MRFVIIALASTVAMPAFAGSLAAPVAEPTVVMAAPAPMATMPAQRSYYGGLSLLGADPEASFTQDDTFPAPSGDLSLDSALGVSGVLGFDYGYGLRVEAELMRFGGDTDTLSFTGAAPNFQEFATDGSYTLTAGMLNAWYSFGNGTIRPFVGGGIGVMHADVDTDFTIANNPLNVSGTDTVFAWQVGAGAEMAITDRISLVGTYRYLEANGFDLADSQTTAIEADLNTNIFTLGATYRF